MLRDLFDLGHTVNAGRTVLDGVIHFFADLSYWNACDGCAWSDEAVIIDPDAIVDLRMG